MTKPLKIVAAFVVLLGAILFSPGAALAALPDAAKGTYLVLVNANNRYSGDYADMIATIRRLYLKQQSAWPDLPGSVPLARYPDSDAHKAFRQIILDMSKAELEAHWQRLEAGSAQRRPTVVVGAKRVLRQVARKKGAFSVIRETEARKLPAKTRILFKFTVPPAGAPEPATVAAPAPKPATQQVLATPSIGAIEEYLADPNGKFRVELRRYNSRTNAFQIWGNTSKIESIYETRFLGEERGAYEIQLKLRRKGGQIGALVVYLEQNGDEFEIVGHGQQALATPSLEPVERYLAENQRDLRRNLETYIFEIPTLPGIVSTVERVQRIVRTKAVRIVDNRYEVDVNFLARSAGGSSSTSSPYSDHLWRIYLVADGGSFRISEHVDLATGVASQQALAPPTLEAIEQYLANPNGRFRADLRKYNEQTNAIRTGTGALAWFSLVYGAEILDHNQGVYRIEVTYKSSSSPVRDRVEVLLKQNGGEFEIIGHEQEGQTATVSQGHAWDGVWAASGGDWILNFRVSGGKLSGSARCKGYAGRYNILEGAVTRSGIVKATLEYVGEHAGSGLGARLTGSLPKPILEQQGGSAHAEGRAQYNLSTCRGAQLSARRTTEAALAALPSSIETEATALAQQSWDGVWAASGTEWSLTFEISDGKIFGSASRRSERYEIIDGVVTTNGTVEASLRLRSGGGAKLYYGSATLTGTMPRLRAERLGSASGRASQLVARRTTEAALAALPSSTETYPAALARQSWDGVWAASAGRWSLTFEILEGKISGSARCESVRFEITDGVITTSGTVEAALVKISGKSGISSDARLIGSMPNLTVEQLGSTSICRDAQLTTKRTTEDLSESPTQSAAHPIARYETDGLWRGEAIGFSSLDVPRCQGTYGFTATVEDGQLQGEMKKGGVTIKWSGSIDDAGRLQQVKGRTTGLHIRFRLSDTELTGDLSEDQIAGRWIAAGGSYICKGSFTLARQQGSQTAVALQRQSWDGVWTASNAFWSVTFNVSDGKISGSARCEVLIYEITDGAVTTSGTVNATLIRKKGSNPGISADGARLTGNMPKLTIEQLGATASCQDAQLSAKRSTEAPSVGPFASVDDARAYLQANADQVRNMMEQYNDEHGIGSSTNYSFQEIKSIEVDRVSRNRVIVRAYIEYGWRSTGGRGTDIFYYELEWVDGEPELVGRKRSS